MQNQVMATEPRLTAVEVRDARPADSTVCAQLLAQLGYPSPQDSVRRRLEVLSADKTNRVVVAEAEGQVVGLATAYVRPLIHRDESLVRIAALIVERRWRSRGVGHALVETIERWGREQGCGVSEVMSGQGRIDAHRFYESLGYAEKRKRFVKEL